MDLHGWNKVSLCSLSWPTSPSCLLFRKPLSSGPSDRSLYKMSQTHTQLFHHFPCWLSELPAFLPAFLSSFTSEIQNDHPHRYQDWELWYHVDGNLEVMSIIYWDKGSQAPYSSENQLETRKEQISATATQWCTPSSYIKIFSSTVLSLESYILNATCPIQLCFLPLSTNYIPNFPISFILIISHIPLITPEPMLPIGPFPSSFMNMNCVPVPLTLDFYRIVQ